MLNLLQLRDVGPTRQMNFQFAPHLNILTGDNGLGKTFILDIVWFILTTTWPVTRAFPHRSNNNPTNETPSIPSITAKFRWQNNGEFEPITKYQYEKQSQQWIHDWHPNKTSSGFAPHPEYSDEALTRPPCIVLYARSDSGISLWDVLRTPARLAEFKQGAVHLTHNELWEGKRIENKETGETRVICKGLLDDWINWRSENSSLHTSLLEILSILSPPEEKLIPGRPIVVRKDEDRLIPTLTFPYGTVPVTLASAGMKRILGIAYALIWMWNRHMQVVESDGLTSSKEIIILIDEIEAHLHPQWQRCILPALVKAMKVLSPDAHVQWMISTHAPLVLASIEPLFDEAQDNLYHFHLDGNTVSIQELPFAKQGDVSHWLVSEAFGLARARSVESERAIHGAMAFMRGDTDAAGRWIDGITPAGSAGDLPIQARVHAALCLHLADHDPFWARWIGSYEDQP